MNSSLLYRVKLINISMFFFKSENTIVKYIRVEISYLIEKQSLLLKHKALSLRILKTRNEIKTEC